MKTNGDITTYNYATVRGRKMFYREAGNKDTPTIVLLHGFPSSRTFFFRARQFAPANTASEKPCQKSGKIHAKDPRHTGAPTDRCELPQAF
jgi:pimeloyl-ACP methyl ester carboxylesterase